MKYTIFGSYVQWSHDEVIIDNLVIHFPNKMCLAYVDEWFCMPFAKIFLVGFVKISVIPHSMILGLVILSWIAKETKLHGWFQDPMPNVFL